MRRTCHTWLHREIVDWLQGGLITPAQGQTLRARYPLAGYPGLGRSLLSALGAVIFGLGVILLVAYNWQAMHRFAKLALLLGALAAAHLGALWLRRSGRHSAAEGLHALGSVLFGAAIWLVAQVYHIEGHYPNAFLVWGLGTLALAWALPSATQALLAVVLVLTWQVSELFDFHSRLDSLPWLLLLGVLPLCRQLGSVVLSGTATLALLLSLALGTFPLDEDLTVPLLVLAAGAAVAAGRLLEGLGQPGDTRIAAGFARPGYGVYLVALYLLSFPSLSGSLFHIHLTHLRVAGLFSGALALTAGLWAAVLTAPLRGRPATWRDTDWLLLAGLVLVALFSLLGLRGGGWLTALPFNLLLLLHGMLLILTGMRGGDSRRLLGGGLLIGLLAAGRYLDLFESLVARALVFFAVGAALFALGHLWRRRGAAP